jgi:hypothetical protein
MAISFAPAKFNPGVLAAFSLWILYMAYSTIAGRLEIEADGTILKREAITRYQRPGAIYTLAAPDGALRTLASGCTDSSLPRELPVGGRLVKRKNDLSYTLDGRTVSDFPLPFYGATAGLGLSLLVLSGMLFMQQRRSNQSLQPTAGRRGAPI